MKIVYKFSIAIATILVALIILKIAFIHKVGETCGFCIPGQPVSSEMTCHGYRFTWNDCPNCLDAGTTIYCLGIVGNQKICRSFNDTIIPC